MLFLSSNGGLEKIRLAYILKHNSDCENQVILVMITDGENWHYLAVKRFSRLFHEITSKHIDDHGCVNCLHSFRTESKLKLEENVCKNHHYCSLTMPEGHDKIFRSSQNYKFMNMKILFVI